MSYVTGRPLELTNYTSIQDAKLQLNYEFNTPLKDSIIKSFDHVSDISMHGIMLNTPPNNEKVVNFNGKDYVYNHIGITRHGDKINEDHDYFIYMCFSDQYYVEKLYIFQPIVQGNSGTIENKRLLEQVINLTYDDGSQVEDSGNGRNELDEVSLDYIYDLNNFIPSSTYKYYQFKNTNNSSVTGIISFSENDSLFYASSGLLTKLGDILNGSQINDITTTSGTIYNITLIPRRTNNRDDETGSNIDLNDNEIYIDCQPISKKENGVAIVNPMKIYEPKLGTFFDGESDTGYTFKYLTYGLILLLLIGFSIYIFTAKSANPETTIWKSFGTIEKWFVGGFLLLLITVITVFIVIYAMKHREMKS